MTSPPKKPPLSSLSRAFADKLTKQTKPKPNIELSISAEPEKDPAWLAGALGQGRRTRGVNGSDPIGPRVPGLVPEPEEGEHFGSLRERAVQKELAAAIINVSTASIHQWAINGTIRLLEDGLVPILEVRRKTIEVGRERAGQKRTVEGEEDPKLRKDRADADLAELKFTNALAAVVSKSSAAARYADIAASMKVRLMSLADRLSKTLVGITDPHRIRVTIETEVRETLAIMAKPFVMKRREEELSDGGAGTPGGSGGEEERPPERTPETKGVATGRPRGRPPKQR